MLKLITKATFIILFIAAHQADAQYSLFRTKDRMDNLEGFDDQKFSWGFFLAANNYDYKLVLDPVYGMSPKTNAGSNQKNLVHAKGTYGFGAGLIGKMRLNENFDLRLEPGLQFAHRELIFDTQANDRFSAGNNTNQPFTPQVLTEFDKNRIVKSTYIDVPLLLEFHGNRWYNSRPYAAAGVNYMVNLQSSQGSADDNSLGIYRSTTHNFGWSVEAGIQFYFSRFKLTPAFRGTFITNNESIKDNAGTPPYWAAAIATAQSRIFMFVLKFE